jgi:cell division protein FtsQ
MTTTDLPPTTPGADDDLSVDTDVSGDDDISIETDDPSGDDLSVETDDPSGDDLSMQSDDPRSVDPRMRDRWVSARRAEGRRRLRIVAAVVASLSVVGIAFLVAESPLLGAGTVTVKGTSQATATQVRAAAHIDDGEPLLFLDTAGIARRVEALPGIAGAQVETELPRTVIITVTERVPVAWIRTTANPPIAVVDATGHVMSTVAAPPTQLPEVVDAGALPRLGAEVANPSAFRGFAELPPPLRLLARTLTVSDGQGKLTISGTPPGADVVIFGPMVDMRRKGVAALAVLRDLASRAARVGELDVTVPDAPVTRGSAPAR